MYFKGLTFIFSEDPPENHLMVIGGLLLKYYVLLLFIINQYTIKWHSILKSSGSQHFLNTSYFFVSHIVTKQKLYFCINPDIFSFSMPKASLVMVLSEIEVTFSGNDQEVLCALAEAEQKM